MTEDCNNSNTENTNAQALLQLIGNLEGYAQEVQSTKVNKMEAIAAEQEARETLQTHIGNLRHILSSCGGSPIDRIAFAAAEAIADLSDDTITSDDTVRILRDLRRNLLLPPATDESRDDIAQWDTLGSDRLKKRHYKDLRRIEKTAVTHFREKGLMPIAEVTNDDMWKRTDGRRETGLRYSYIAWERSKDVAVKRRQDHVEGEPIVGFLIASSVDKSEDCECHFCLTDFGITPRTVITESVAWRLVEKMRSIIGSHSKHQYIEAFVGAENDGALEALRFCGFLPRAFDPKKQEWHLQLDPQSD